MPFESRFFDIICNVDVFISRNVAELYVMFRIFNKAFDQSVPESFLSLLPTGFFISAPPITMQDTLKRNIRCLLLLISDSNA